MTLVNKIEQENHKNPGMEQIIFIVFSIWEKMLEKLH